VLYSTTDSETSVTETENELIGQSQDKVSSKAKNQPQPRKSWRQSWTYWSQSMQQIGSRIRCSSRWWLFCCCCVYFIKRITQGGHKSL